MISRWAIVCPTLMASGFTRGQRRAHFIFSSLSLHDVCSRCFRSATLSLHAAARCAPDRAAPRTFCCRTHSRRNHTRACIKFSYRGSHWRLPILEKKISYLVRGSDVQAMDDYDSHPTCDVSSNADEVGSGCRARRHQGIKHLRRVQFILHSVIIPQTSNTSSHYC